MPWRKIRSRKSVQKFCEIAVIWSGVKIFASSAEGLKPTYRGTKDSKVGPVFGTALTRVEQGKQPAAEAWTQALKEATDAAK